MSKYYLCSLYRFGYEFTVLSSSKREAKRLLMEEYKKTFKAWNECSPSSKEITTARQDIECCEYWTDVVSWS